MPSPVVTVELSWRGQEQTRRNGETTRTDVWTVTTEAPAEGVDIRNEIEADTRVPQYGSTPADRSDIFAKNISTREAGGPRLWEVAVTYSSVPNPDALDPDTPPDQPELDPPSVGFAALSESVVFDIDEDGTPVANSSMEPFDPPLQRQVDLLVLTYSRNFPECTITPEWVRGFTNVVNNSSIEAFGARGEVLIKGIPDPVWIPTNGAVPGHWRVTLTLVIRRQPDAGEEPDAPPYSAHFRRVLDQGYRTTTGYTESGEGPPAFELIRSDDGNPVNQPVLLDGNGGKLTGAGTPKFRYFREYREADFSELGLVWPYCDGSVSGSVSGSGSSS